jgi:hypothetical protein
MKNMLQSLELQLCSKLLALIQITDLKTEYKLNSKKYHKVILGSWIMFWLSVQILCQLTSLLPSTIDRLKSIMKPHEVSVLYWTNSYLISVSGLITEFNV